MIETMKRPQKTKKISQGNDGVLRDKCKVSSLFEKTPETRREEYLEIQLHLRHDQ